MSICLLKRFVADMDLASDKPFTPQCQPDTDKKVAIVGAGPAGLACAHRLAMLCHEAVIFEARPKSGGLNEYGIAAYKAAENIAQREV